MSSFVERVKQIIAYDPLSGVFTWKENRGGSAKAGSKAGAYREADGYTLANSSQNKFNACLRKDSFTGVKSVGYDKKRKKWTGRVRADGKIVRARFDSMEEDAEFCESQRLNLHGEFLNNGERK